MREAAKVVGGGAVRGAKRSVALDAPAWPASRLDPILNRITGLQSNDAPELDLRRVLDDPPNVAGFSESVREVFERLDLDAS